MSMTPDILTAEQAVALIGDGDSVLFGGFIGSVVPEELEVALGARYKKEQTPENITVIYAAGQGDGKTRALNHIAQQGLVAKVIGGHWGLVPGLQSLAIDNQIQAYNLPQGVISHLCRDISAGKPGTLSKIGLGTFVDPRLEGGRVNSVTTEDIVEVMDFMGEEYLFYHRFPLDFALLRGTTADEDGNITMQDEALTICNQVAAAACHNSGGKVIVQVKEIVPRGELHPQMVKIPGIYVDVVVVNSNPDLHMQTYDAYLDERKVMQAPRDVSLAVEVSHRSLDARRIIARRAAQELRPEMIVNFGIGAPEEVANVACAEGIDDYYTATIEAGAIGGAPAGGLSFGTSVYPQAIVSQDYQFDFYDGGGLDQAFLGMAQADTEGNINVSRFGDRIAGCGGFINISQNAKEVIYCGTFTTRGLEVSVEDAHLRIIQEGRQQKFLNQVEQTTFSGKQALRRGQRVLYVTERAVFSLSDRGLTLEELAPGMDFERDILAQMAFRPVISSNLKEMDAAIFREGSLGLKQGLKQPA